MFALWIFCATALLCVCSGENLDTMYEWKYFDYTWKNPGQKQKAVDNGDYSISASVPIDVDNSHGKTFVTTIRDKGVPSTLNIVSRKRGPGGPLLQPYPSWHYNNNGCNGLTSVYRVSIDRCNRLWALDSGIIGSDRVCKAKLHVFDLTRDRLVNRIEIPNEVAQNTTTGKGLLVTPAVWVHPFDCNKFRVYMADVEGYGIIKYDGKSFERFTSASFNFDPKATKYTIQGESFNLEDGIVGMALTPKNTEHPTLFYRPMSSYDMDSIPLKDFEIAQQSDISAESYKNVLPSQAAAMVISRNGILFFGLTKETTLACWNHPTPHSPASVTPLVTDPKRLQFASGMKLYSDDGNEVLAIMTNRLQKIYDGTMNYNETNFRILIGPVPSLIDGKKCQPVC